MALRRLLERLGLTRKQALRNFELDVSLHSMLDSMAEQQQRSPDELASNIVASALARQVGHEALLRSWNSLTPRLQQVTALTCLGYTNRQIAGRLGITINTVHTHSQRIQYMFNVNSKADLRYLMREWDFSAWVD